MGLNWRVLAVAAAAGGGGGEREGKGEGEGGRRRELREALGLSLALQAQRESVLRGWVRTPWPRALSSTPPIPPPQFSWAGTPGRRWHVWHMGFASAFVMLQPPGQFLVPVEGDTLCRRASEGPGKLLNPPPAPPSSPVNPRRVI